MIESISISNVATYDATGITVEGLSKVNFIYGANGTGKTTITNLLEEEKHSDFANSSVKWQHDMALQTLVYNKNFRERNFGKGKMDGVFTLGEATKEEKDAIEFMVSQLAEIKDAGLQRKSALEKLIEQKEEYDNSFRDAAWVDVYKKHEVVFKEAFAGAMRRDTLRDKLVAQSKANKAALKTYEELKNKAETIFGEVPVELPPIDKIDLSRLSEIEVDKIWEKKIIGKGDIEIAKLIQRLNLNDWVNEGRGYLQDSAVCPFCQKETITSDFRVQLDNYFNEEFKENTERVKVLWEEYNRLAENLSNQLQELESSESANLKTKIDISKLASYNKTAAAQFQSNKERLSNKSKEPSRSVSLHHTEEQLGSIAGLIADANIKIKAHNEIVRNYDKEREGLIELIWKYLVDEYKASIEEYLHGSSGKQKGIDSLDGQRKDLLAQYVELNKKIKEANKNVTSIQPSVDEINRTLKAYGFLNFEIVPSPKDKNQYQIHREDGTIAESTLSEGEITFITFLYYLQLAKGGHSEDSVSDDRVLVIDDPISSLDSNVLFVVSSLIKEILEETRGDSGNIKQVILLTHNVYFHKEVSFIDGKPEKRNNTFFWILRKKNKVTAIQPFGMENPILNSYELLWRELKNRDHNDGVTIQNIMRRIIEHYFKILGKYPYKHLIESFADNPEEQGICRSMIYWINDGSHSIPDDLFIQTQDDPADKYFSVFEKIFLNTNHHEHFKMMMGEEYLAEAIGNPGKRVRR